MSAKTKATISLDPHIWDQFKNENESASEKIEDLIKTWLNTQGNDLTELKDRKEKLLEEKEELEKQVSKIEERIDSIEGELDSIDAALEKHKKENKRVEKAVNDLSQKVNASREQRVREKVKDLSTTQAYHNWLEKLEVDSEELKERIIEEVAV